MKIEQDIQEREMVRCEVTGKLFPVEDCEVVIIRITKAKSADINSLAIFNKEEKTPASFNVPNMPVSPSISVPATVVPLDNPDVVQTTNGKPARDISMKRSAIPAGIASVFRPHDTPGSAVETRHA